MATRQELWTDGRLVELVENNGDGTGLRTTYNADGSVQSTQALTGLPIPPPPTPEPVVALATALLDAQSLEEVRAAAAAALAAAGGA